MYRNIAILVAVLIVGIFLGAWWQFVEAPGPEAENGSDQEMSTSTLEQRTAFTTALQEGVKTHIGQPIEGYEPAMFLQVFPKLVPADFHQVDASIGVYAYANGELTHDLEGETLIHSAAGAITDEGMGTLLQNVAARLDISFQRESAVEAVLDIIRGTEKPVSPDAPVACTLEAKQCPDGSFVGRTGPNCEFAPCPEIQLPDTGDGEATVCTPEMKSAEACIDLYAPVCGLVQVQCFTTPCNPVPETFSNGCYACAQGNVISYTDGACEAP